VSSENERKKRLDNFDKTFNKDLADALQRQDMEIKQRYSQEFANEMNKAEECAKNGDFFGANLHRLRAGMIHDFLKD
jgi:hypothetical protein